MKTTHYKSGLIFLAFIFSFSICLFSQTGPNNPGTVTVDASYGTVSWTNMIFASGSDNLWAVTSTTLSNGASSNYLVATDFGFSINPCDNVTGIEVRIEWSKPSGATVTDDAIRLVVGGVIQSAVNKANATVLPVSDAVTLYGNSTDPWGLSLAGADVNASNFGVAIAVKRSGGGAGPTPQIDHVTITLYHSTPPTMTYSSTAVSQISTLVNPNTQNNQVIRIDVNTNTGCPAISASSFTFNMNGTTSLSDIANARLYYTGTSSTFTTVAQLGSTVASPSGSFDINGFSQSLKSGINYFWLAVDVVAGAIISNLVDAQCTALIVDGISRTPTPTSPAGSRTITAPVTFTVGSSGENYTTIQAAYNAIPASPANGYIIDIYGDYNSGLETFPIVFGNKSNASNIIVRPALGETGIVCAGSLASQGIWNLDNAQNIIIDGRPGSIGTTNQFIVRNTKSSAPYGTAFLIRNDAHDISFVYMTIEAETSTGASLDGIVTIGPTTGTTGNDNIYFSLCTFRVLSVGGSGVLPFAGVYSSGTSSKTNDNIVVDSCKFPNGGFPAISFFANTSNTTTTNNHIYCPTGMTISGAPAQGIYVNSGSDHVISGNFIGGTAASCGGGQFNISAGTDQVAGIYINASGNNYVMSNQFSNFRYTTTYNLASYPLVGISLNGGGNYFVGESGKGNLIGSMAGTGNMLLTHNGSSGSGFAGIENKGTGTASITFNNMGGVTVNGTWAGATTRLITNTSGTTTVSNNILGSPVANNILVSSNAGLNAINNSSAQGITISNNTIQNLDHNGTSGGFLGINNSAGNFACNSNVLYEITTATTTGGAAFIQHSGATAAIDGNSLSYITLENTGAGSDGILILVNSASDAVITNNTIGSITPDNIVDKTNHNLWGILHQGAGKLTCTGNILQQVKMENTGTSNVFYGISAQGGELTATANSIKDITSLSTGASSRIFGIYSSGGAATGVISNNMVQNLHALTATPSTPYCTGIWVQTGGGTIEKNFISGFTNTAPANTAALIGIWNQSGTWNLYNNVIILDNGTSTNDLLIYGVYYNTASGGNVYHNTVKIAGSVTSGTQSTTAFRRSATATGADMIKNNIFQNIRVNGGLHRAIEISNITGATVDYNYLEVDPSQSANIGKWGATDYNFSNWKTNSGATNDVTGTTTIDANGYASSPFPGAGTGTNLTASVPLDKNDFTRGIAPWMGAFEGPNITTSAISPLEYCAGGAVSVPYTIGGSGNFNGGNIFTAELSDEFASFDSPTAIGTLASTTSGTIATVIPISTPAGSQYIIRVSASDPLVIGYFYPVYITVSSGIPVAPTANAASGFSCSGFTANWTASDEATTYFLDVATDAGFTAFVTGYNNLDVENVTSKAITGLIAGTNYYYRIRAGNGCGTSGNSGSQPLTTSGSQQIFVVSSTANSGAGTLNQAILDANANCGHDIINFNLGAAIPYTITLTALLPNLTDPDGVTMDGFENGANDGTPNSVPVFNTTAGSPMNPSYAVILGNNNNLATGLVIASGSNNNVIRGLVLQDFGDGTSSGNDIAITISGNANKILGCYIGIGNDGVTGGTKTHIGVSITGANNQIGDGTAAGANLISGANSFGVNITSASATGNSVKGNMVGLQKDGSTLVSGGQSDGIVLNTSAILNTIGGSSAGEGNVISGQGGSGIYLNTAGNGSNTISGNIIGPRADGVTYVTGNTQGNGFWIFNSNNNIIGGNTPGERNIISANETAGIAMPQTSTGNIIKGNYIGIAKNGTSFITGSTQDYGVRIWEVSNSNIIGGSGAGEGNVISGNNNAVSSGRGISLESSSASGNTVIGNIIGPQADGITYLANNAQFFGVSIAGSPNNVIGGNTAGTRNIISANETYGVYIEQAGATGNTVKGNYIGIDKTGTTFITLSSQSYGVYITSSSASNTIGGSSGDEGNVISGNLWGIFIVSLANNNNILGNIIGPQADGVNYLNSNAQTIGVYIETQNNIIGGNTFGARNIISANENQGIYLWGSNSIGNVIKGNYIGIDKNGSSFISSSTQDYGVYITGSAESNIIGGSSAGEGNVISGNKDAISLGKGIYLNSTASGGNTVVGNIIGPQADGVTDLALNAQSHGVYIDNSPNNTIGGNSAGARNIISANETYGVYIEQAGATGNTVKGNYIGIDKTGTTFISNSTQDFGVFITTSAASNTIGGSGAGEGNVISGNNDCCSTGRGIYLQSAAVAGNTILGNIIGPQADGVTYLPSSAQDRGIEIDASLNNIIGGSAAGARNIISANKTCGFYIFGATSSGNSIKGNYIGPSSTLASITSSSQDYGVYIFSSATNNKIGTGLANEENQIAFNTVNGVYLIGAATTGNLISKDPIYSNTGKPINLNYGASQANNGKAIPVITTATTVTVSGTSEPNNIIEVFKNTSGSCNDATTYVGSTTADGSGNWSLAVSLSECDYVLATATDGSNNTSEFSTCVYIPPSSLTTSAIVPTSYCAGGPVSVPFTVPCTFNSGNVFTAQLSDASGSFTTPTVIGTLSSQTNGTINAEIPSATPAGAGYRIRVISSNPSLTGTDNGTDISINVCSRYWVGNAGNWNDTDRWSDVTGGSPPGTGGKSVPHKGVYVFLDGNSFTGPGQIITMPVGTWYMKNISFSGYGQNVVIIGQGAMVVGQ